MEYEIAAPLSIYMMIDLHVHRLLHRDSPLRWRGPFLRRHLVCIDVLTSLLSLSALRSAGKCGTNENESTTVAMIAMIACLLPGVKLTATSDNVMMR
jgi:hypothetical protein